MSFTKNAESFSKFNRKMHNATTITNETITQAVSTALRNAVGYMPSASKIVAHKVQRNQRAARNWLDGLNAPRAAELIELMREFDEVHQEVLRLANRSPEEPAGSTQQRIEQAIKILCGGENNEINSDRISRVGRIHGEDRR